VSGIEVLEGMLGQVGQRFPLSGYLAPEDAVSYTRYPFSLELIYFTQSKQCLSIKTTYFLEEEEVIIRSTLDKN